MILKSWFGRGLEWKIGGYVALAAVLSIGVSDRVLAQIVPDKTLGVEGSVVTPNVNIKGISSDRIDGGATRGANLFHSFQEFNVGSGRGAYFANPTGIENILTRVTGSNPSNILGRLGVLGGANLFLINPHGIVFGANASLDIQGSFLATTADRVQLGDSGYFSASQPQTSSLLSVSPGALFFSQVANQPTAIINQGNLSTGKHLTLSAGNLDLQGQLKALGDLTLQAQDTVKVRDSATIPFIASAGGNLLVQGNHRVDIFALSHPESGLFSGGDMVLRSSNTVGGDAHYWSRGSFRIEQLDGSLGNLFSLHDPIIRARGDVFINTYRGGSLHILAGGKVEIPNYVWIQGADPENGLVETVNLADGTTVSINGKSEPTLDIRAGVNPDVIGEQILTRTGTGNFIEPAYATSNQSSADIRIGTILFADADSQPLAGRVLLTNQYQPNSSLSGDIQVTQSLQGEWGAIFMDGGAGNPSVAINSRGGITLDGTVKTSSSSGDGGAISLTAVKGNINTGNLFSYSGNIYTFFSRNDGGNGGDIILSAAKGNITTGNLFSGSFGNAGQGGAINLTATNGSITTGNDIITSNDIDIFVTANLNSSSFGNAGKGGTINLNATNGSIITGSLNSASLGNAGEGGAINLNATNGSITSSYLSSSSLSLFSYGNAGQGGEINLNATNDIFITGNLNSLSYSSNGNAGEGGAINLNAGNDIFIRSDLNSVNLTSYSFSSSGKAGQGGAISLTADNDIFINGDLYSYSYSRFGTEGQGGAISLQTRGGDISGRENQSIVLGNQSTVLGSFSVSEQGTAGNGGKVSLEAKNNVSNLEILTLSSDSQSGAVQVRGLEDLLLTNTKILTSKQATIPKPFAFDEFITLTDREGQSGDVTVTSLGNLTFNNSSIQSDTKGSDPAGNVTVSSPGLVTFNNNSFIRSNTSSTGAAGSIGIKAGQGITLVGSDRELFAGTTNQRETRDIILINVVGGVKVPEMVKVFASTNGFGDNSTIRANTSNAMKLDIGLEDFSSVLSVETSSAGQPGNIIINTPSLTLSNTARITATATSTATNPLGGGSISLNASNMDLAGVVGVFAETQGQTPAGTLTLKPYENQSTLNLTLAPNSLVSASTTGSGKGGNLIVQAPEAITIQGPGQLAVKTTGDGAAGELRIDTQKLTIADGATISASTDSKNPEGTGGSIIINATESFNLTNASLGAQSTGAAPAGNIKINTPNLTATNGTIATSSKESSGGGIIITADKIRLFGDSDITTFVAQGAGGGGNIKLTADSIVAFDDTDILAYAPGGTGGNITLDTPAFFGENYSPASSRNDPLNLDGNNRVNVNATGAINGVITLPDVSFIQNSLTELPENQINTDSLLANSCIVRRNQPTRGSFTITGTGGLPQRPGDAQISSFPTVDVKTLPSDSTLSNTNPNPSWQKSDPIVEPQGVYRLPNGKLVLSRECS
ncbi:MAG: filamentous hemagglutinin N-terminal domain-containing protein [Nostoc sp.]|uniref:two-partner secretion domain-containing protein n=1 Tax=Nostoc sp. TaxID=1180 RepID=UPI002FF49039